MEAAVSAEVVREQGLVCGNCHAPNPANAVVCASCGVNLAAFPAALDRIRQLEQTRAAEYAAALSATAASRRDREASASRRRLRYQLAGLLGAAIIGLLLALGALHLHQAQQRAQAERLAAADQRAQACLDAGQYLCARDGFLALTREQADYPGAQAALVQARDGLAAQYETAGQWQKALAELDAVLDRTPGDPATVALEQDLFSRWMADAAGRGDYVTVVRVGLLREARFPPGAATTRKEP
jgi:hypothetical protein